jgi:hemerythrin-like metal-binding protein
MNEIAFNRWLLHTSRDWDDIKDIVEKTYIPAIDRDHRQLARYALDLNLIVEKIQRKEITLSILKEEKKTLKQFLNYAKEHFDREEKVFKAFGLLGIEAQEKDHEQTIEKIEELLVNLEKGKIIFTQDNKTELLEWIIEHTNGHDVKMMRLAAFVNYFNGVSEFEDVVFFVNYSGFPQIDKAQEEFFKVLIKKLNGSEKDIVQDVLVAYNDFLKCVLDVDEKYGLSLAHKLEKRFRTFQPFSNVKAKNPKSKGILISEFLTFISKEVISEIEISNWLPRKLEDYNSFEDLFSFIRPTSRPEVDISFEKLIRLTFESYEASLGDDKTAFKNKVTELALLVNQHFILIEKTSKDSVKEFAKYYTENFKRLRIYLDKAFLHILSDRLEYSISLRNKILFQCVYQNNLNDYVNFKFQPLDMISKEAA